MRAGPASYADVEGRPSEYGEVATISDIIFPETLFSFFAFRIYGEVATISDIIFPETLFSFFAFRICGEVATISEIIFPDINFCLQNIWRGINIIFPEIFFSVSTSEYIERYQKSYFPKLISIFGIEGFLANWAPDSRAPDSREYDDDDCGWLEV